MLFLSPLISQNIHYDFTIAMALFQYFMGKYAFCYLTLAHFGEGFVKAVSIAVSILDAKLYRVRKSLEISLHHLYRISYYL